MKTIRKQNKLVIFSEKEYTLHLVVKAMLMKNLLYMGRERIFSECPIPNTNKIVDVLDDENRVFYEIERIPSKAYKERIRKLSDKLNAKGVILDLSQIPPELREALIELETWVITHII